MSELINIITKEKCKGKSLFKFKKFRNTNFEYSEIVENYSYSLYSFLFYVKVDFFLHMGTE